VLAVIGGLLAYDHYRTQVESRRVQASQLNLNAQGSSL